MVEVAVGRVHEGEQVLASVLAKRDETRGRLARESRFVGCLGADGKVLAVVTHRGGFGRCEGGRGKGKTGEGCCSRLSPQAKSRKEGR